MLLVKTQYSKHTTDSAGFGNLEITISFINNLFNYLSNKVKIFGAVRPQHRIRCAQTRTLCLC